MRCRSAHSCTSLTAHCRLPQLALHGCEFSGNMCCAIGVETTLILLVAQQRRSRLTREMLAPTDGALTVSQLCASSHVAQREGGRPTTEEHPRPCHASIYGSAALTTLLACRTCHLCPLGHCWASTYCFASFPTYFFYPVQRRSLWFRFCINWSHLDHIMASPLHTNYLQKYGSVYKRSLFDCSAPEPSYAALLMFLLNRT